jgi:hypothetical protein
MNNTIVYRLVKSMQSDEQKKLNEEEDRQFYAETRDAFTQSEFIHPDLESWIYLLAEMHKDKMLLPKEWVDDLPDGEFRIYRGGTPNGFSWSLDKGTAKWFATRFKIIGIADKVYTMLVTKAEVLWYTDARNEQEVVLIPDQKKVEEAK